MAAVSRWALDEGTGTSVADSVGSNTGTLNNATGWSAVVAPTTFANSNSLLGVHAYKVDLANAATIGVTSSYSFSMWIRWDALPGDRDVAFGLKSSPGDFDLGIGSSFDGDNKVGFDVGVAGSSYQSCKSAATIVTGQWYHVAVVLRNGSADLYVNGSYEATCTYDAATLLAVDNSGGMTIGAQGYNGSDVFMVEGYVDDVRTFDHELSGAEISALAARVATTPVVSLTQSTTSIAENGGAVTITAVMDSTASSTVTIAVGFAGTAATGSDYTLSTDTITIASGQTSGSITATAVNDLVYEGNETFTASITSVTGGSASASSTASASVITIIDDESAPSVSLSASPTSIAENGGVAVVTALLGNASYQNVTVNFGFSGSATLNADYSASSNSLIVSAGQTSGSISITAINDAAYEGNESILVGITSVTNGSAGSTASLSITIVDDDSPAAVVTLTSSTSSITENVGSTIVRAIMSATYSSTVTVALGFAGTATNNTDYSASTNSIAIASGQTSGSISITAIQDLIAEGNETVLVSIASVTSGLSASTDTLTIIIVDDELSGGAKNMLLMGVG